MWNFLSMKVLEHILLRHGRKVTEEQMGAVSEALAAQVILCHRRPFVGASRPRSWSRFPVFGANLLRIFLKS